MPRNKEIERKFLVCGEYKSLATKSIIIEQGYLCILPEIVIRVRLQDNKSFINVKKPINKGLIERDEWEIEIPYNEGKTLMEACDKEKLIFKTRYLINIYNILIEVDEFAGKNKGLVVAEIELTDINQEIPKLNWLGKEVSNDIKYSNFYLSENPFTEWTENL